MCGGEAWRASQRPALVHPQGTLGSLLNLWGHSPGQQGQSCRESRRKLGVLRKILAVLWIEVDKLAVNVSWAFTMGWAPPLTFILHQFILFSRFFREGTITFSFDDEYAEKQE